MEVFETVVNYKNADNCKACPKRNDENGCPWWWEWVEMNASTGQERLRKACGKQSMQVFMVEVIKASNRPAAAVESTRNEIVKGFDRLASVAMQTQKIKPGVIRKMLGWGKS